MNVWEGSHWGTSDFLPLKHWNIRIADTKTSANMKHPSSGLQLLWRAFPTCFLEDLLADGQILTSCSLPATFKCTDTYSLPNHHPQYLFRGGPFTFSFRYVSVCPLSCSLPSDKHRPHSLTLYGLVFPSQRAGEQPATWRNGPFWLASSFTRALQ